MIKVSLVIITDGRIDLLEQTLQSLANKVKYPFFEKLIINDSVDANGIFKKSVDNLSLFYGLTAIHHEEKRGFAGSYDTAFNSISKESDYAFIVEDDFLFNEQIDIQTMIFILQYNRNLIQVSLKRQPWGEEEKKVGGFMEQWPDLYEEKEVAGFIWCEHRLFYTTNPSLVPKFVIERSWPLQPHSESVFGQRLFSNPNFKAAYLGHRNDNPKVNHIGVDRKGNGY